MAKIQKPIICRGLYSEEVRGDAQREIDDNFKKYCSPFVEQKLSPIDEAQLAEGFARISNMCVGTEKGSGRVFEDRIQKYLERYGALNNTGTQDVSVFGRRARDVPEKNFRLVQPGVDSSGCPIGELSFAIYVRFRLPESKG
jgi:hypothetical protein